MTHVLLVFWLIIAIMITFEKKIARIIIYLGIFSLVASVCYLLMGAPDVAMAEAAASAFMVLFFIVCFERYYNFGDISAEISKDTQKNRKNPKDFVRGAVKVLAPIVFTVSLFGLFFYFREDVVRNTALMDAYLYYFVRDVGGENPITAIYLGYRVYDTLFEALVVVLSVLAAVHLSAIGENTVVPEQHSRMEKSGMAVFAIQVICAIMLLYGAYLILNGHLTPGGGFQGGLAMASFFICRYMIYNINDLPIKKLNRMEEMIFVGIVLFAVSMVFVGTANYLPDDVAANVRLGYILIMNILIGLKVACGFIILFYRFIVVEQV